MNNRYCVDLSSTPLYTDEDIKIFKCAGFDFVHISATDNPEPEEKIAELFERSLKQGVTPVDLHPYYKYNGFFWHDCLEREDAIRFNKRQLELCKYLGIESMVVHPTQGKGNDIVSDFGIDAFKELADYAEKCRIILCVENLRVHLQLTPIFENINSDYLKFCYDSGHHNAFARERDFLGEFGDKLFFTHLHDNDGTKDSHLLPLDGNMDFNKIKSEFNRLNYKGYLNLEIHPKRENYNGDNLYEYLKEGCNRLSRIFG